MSRTVDSFIWRRSSTDANTNILGGCLNDLLLLRGVDRKIRGGGGGGGGGGGNGDHRLQSRGLPNDARL